MPTSTPSTSLGGSTIEPRAGRFRIAVPSWGWGASLFGVSHRDDTVSREEMVQIFGKELKAPALSPRRGKADPGEG